MSERLTTKQLEHLQSALGSSRITGGNTHDFYLYPARFSPDIASAVIELFSRPNDLILDPFMGGGTAIVEALARGRSVVGVDLNTLAHLVATAKTRPLSASDQVILREWAVRSAKKCLAESRIRPPRIGNLPRSFAIFMSVALRQIVKLPFPRQQAFARVVLLRLGQWALDCRDHPTQSRKNMAQKLPHLTDEMLEGLSDFVEACGAAGIEKNEITGRRLLLCRSSVGLHEDPLIQSLTRPPTLVFTSPPYPCVHVLYHRWQIRSRKETAAPYWIAQVSDGHPTRHYTGGSRTPSGEFDYFSMIQTAFASIRQIVAAEALVVQLVGFADIGKQLPKYLKTMNDAGFETWQPSDESERSLWRSVPNRKWYAKSRGVMGASSEVLLFHRPRRF